MRDVGEWKKLRWVSTGLGFLRLILDLFQDLIRLSKLCRKIKIIQLDVQNDLSIQLAVKEIEFEIHNEGLNLLINNAGILEMVSTMCFRLVPPSSFFGERK